MLIRHEKALRIRSKIAFFSNYTHKMLNHKTTEANKISEKGRAQLSLYYTSIFVAYLQILMMNKFMTG